MKIPKMAKNGYKSPEIERALRNQEKVYRAHDQIKELINTSECGRKQRTDNE